MARTFTAGRTGPDVLATEPTLLEVLAALQAIEVDIEAQANPVVVSNGTFGSGTILLPATSGSCGVPYVVPAGKRLRIKAINVSGEGDGAWYVDVDGYTQWTYYNSWSEKGTTVQVEIVATAGQTVTMPVDNYSTHGNTNLYYGQWYGYLENV